jgi:hypothetical protein
MSSGAVLLIALSSSLSRLSVSGGDVHRDSMSAEN